MCVGVCVCTRTFTHTHTHAHTHTHMRIGQKNKYTMWDLRFSQRCWDPSLLSCYARRRESACIQCFYFVGSLFSSLMTIQIKLFCCPTLVPTPTVETLVSWDSLYCLLLELCVLCYKLSCQVLFHLAVIFDSVGVRSLLQPLKHGNCLATNPPCNHKDCNIVS
jgi:hypothetical protein